MVFPLKKPPPKPLEEELPPVVEELPPVEPLELYPLIARLYPRFPALKPEELGIKMTELSTWAQEDPEAFLYDLDYRATPEERDFILRTIGVPEEYFVARETAEEEEARITGLVAGVYPELTPEEFFNYLETDFASFVDDMQTGGMTKEKLDLLNRVLGIPFQSDTELDIQDFFQQIKIVVPIDDVRTLVTMTPDGRAYDAKGRWVGTYNSAAKEFTVAKTDEGFIKEGILDPLRFALKTVWHRGKQFFAGIVPELLYPEMPEWYPAPIRDFMNETNQRMRDGFRKVYALNQAEYDRWVVKHPELIPKPEWEEGWSEHPNLILNPAYMAYEFSSTAPVTVGVMATMGATLALTHNPLLAMWAGMNLMVPQESADVYEALLNAGAPEGQAPAMALFVGTVAGLIETLSDLFVLKLIAPGVAGLFRKELLKEVAKVTVGYTLKKGVAVFTYVEAIEISEELLTQAVTNAALKVYDENVEIWDGLVRTAAKTFAAVLPIAVFGGASTTIAISRQQAAQFIDSEKIKKGWEKDPATDNWFRPMTPEEIVAKLEEGKVIEPEVVEEVPAVPEAVRTLPLEEVSKLETRIPLDLIRKDESVEIARLTKEIQEEGITEPITIRVREDGSQIVWDGLHRLIVAQDLGIKNIPVQFIGDEGIAIKKPPTIPPSPAIEVAKPPVEPEVVKPLPPRKPSAPPIREIPLTPPPVESSQDKLIRLVKEAKPAREETEILKHEELAKRAAKAAGILDTSEGREAFERSKSALRGQLPKADFEAIETQLSEENVKELFNTIKDSDLRYFQKLNTAEALGKVLSGQIPTRGEIELLESIFGTDLAKTLLDKRTLSAKAWELFLDAINLPRAVLASWDLSAPLRQGALMFWGQPKQSLAAFKPMVQAFASEKTTILVAETLAESKYAALRERAGLYQAPLFGVGATLTQREEAFMSQLAKHIPLVRRSERAYVTYLNKVRADVFDSYAAHWEGTGKTLKDYKKLAEAINVMSGRGNLGKLSPLAPILSGIFFSPRYQASRIRLPITFLTATPVVRRMMARNIVAFIAANFAILALLKLAGADLEDDPRSADFGKGKIGNTRLDFWAGFQQYARAVVQIMTGMRKVSTTGRLSEVERSEILIRFIRGKLSPVMGFVADVLEGESFVGEPLSLEPRDVQVQAFNRLVPMFVQDLVEAIDDVGILGTLLAMPGMFGVGVQTYGGGYWDEFLDQLGEPISSDTLPYEVDKEDIYTTKNFYSDALNRTRGMKVEDIDPKYGFPDLAKAVVETANIKKVYEERPNIALYRIAEDEFELYHNQWLEYQKAKTDKEKDAVKEKYPKYYVGNFSQRELSLLRKYHKAKDKDAFLEEHPELKVKPRNDWLKANPLENARLAVFGQAKIYTLEAYNEVNRLIKELDIPDDAVPKFTLPPEGSVENYFKYLEQGDSLGYNSWEVQSIIAQDDNLREFLERQPIEASIDSLELKIKHRDLFEEYDLLETDEDRKALKEANPLWVADMRRIEAIDNDASDVIIERWVERGKAIDEFGAGSSQAKVWLLDNPEAHKWALEKELLSDDGSDWNEAVLRLNVKWHDLDDQYQGFGDKESEFYIEDDDERARAREKLLATNVDYRRDRYRRDAYGMDFPEVENYVTYYELDTKGFRQERMLWDNPTFAKAMHEIAGIDLPEDVPAVQYDDIYDQFKTDFDKLEGLSDHKSPYYIEDTDKRDKTRQGMRFDKEGNLTEFGIAEIRRNGYGKLVPEKHIEAYVTYYSVITKGKPDDWEDTTNQNRWYQDDWVLMENPKFYQEVYIGLLGNEPKDFSNVPTREVFVKWLVYSSLKTRYERDTYRLVNPDLDEWGVSIGIWKITMSEKRRRLSISEQEKFYEDIEEALRELEEELAKLR